MGGGVECTKEVSAPSTQHSNRRRAARPGVERRSSRCQGHLGSRTTWSAPWNGRSSSPGQGSAIARRSTGQSDITKIMGVLSGTDGSGRPARRSGGADLAVAQRPCSVEQPGQRIGEFTLARRWAARQITFDVLDRTRQDVQLVVQRIELGTCNHEFVLAESEFGRSVPGNPVPLPAPARAEDAWPAGPRALRQRSAAPSAVIRGRSSALVTHG